jgi:hypothetical protein
MRSVSTAILQVKPFKSVDMIRGYSIQESDLAQPMLPGVMQIETITVRLWL